MPPVSSAAGLLALLDEPNDDLKMHALKNLDTVVHDYWYQISGSIGTVEALYEDEDFTHRNLAALLASKVFYHLGELDDALTYALGAGNLFDVNDQSEYVQTLIARSLDHYFELRVKQVEKKEDVIIDDRLISIVERMIDRCCTAGQFDQAVGVSIEARRLDCLERVIRASGTDMVRVLQYALKVSQETITNREFRHQVLRLLISLYEHSPAPDYVDMSQCLMFLDDADAVASILHTLLLGSEDQALLAYQVCFNLADNEMQSFLIKVQSKLDAYTPAPPAPPPSDTAPDAATATDMDTDAATASAPAADAATAVVSDAPEQAPTYVARAAHVAAILSGKTQTSLHLDFLYNHNKSDLQLLLNMKGSTDQRNSVHHGAIVAANSFMHAGTSADKFLRDNLDWLSRATNWGKFSATAGLGVIHRGQLAQGRALMAPYLPQDGRSGSPYSEGGALYALGLIYVNHGKEIRQFLLDSLRNTSNEIIQHGGCLGLGLSALGTEDEEIFEDIKNVLYTDSAVAGEAAGISMGLLLAGSASDKAQEMLAYAHDTQHEKIIRGVAMGLALIMYGREEGAETLIEQMTHDQDPIIRFGGMLVIAMAYVGTDNNAAIQKLLHFAVSDVSDDVRRTAVMALGFVLMGVPEQCPKIVSLLAESFNPHVRYGAAMAVGMACAATGQKSAVALLEPMLSDAVDFVRQGALLALSLVMVQQPEAKVAPLRKKIDKFIGDKHEETMCKMGAILAQGVLNAGGRNVTIGLRSRSGFIRRTSVIGLAVFTQYWYWYPLVYFLPLAFQPSALIGLNADLKMPKFSVTSACKPSLFAYPAPVTKETKVDVDQVKAAVLSVTAKAMEKMKKKKAAAAAEGAGTSGGVAGSGGKEGETVADAMDVDAAKKDESASTSAPKKEDPSSYTIENPCRIAPQQVKFISIPSDSRWQPVRSDAPVGIVVMRDTRPEEAVELVHEQTDAQTSGPAQARTIPHLAHHTPAAPATGTRATPPSDEPGAPAPFEYTP